jgi:hypothetical protein
MKLLTQRDLKYGSSLEWIKTKRLERDTDDINIQ